MIKFPCTECGACCKSLKGVLLLQDLDRGDGICKYFNETTNLCMIYEERPLLCNIDKSYELIFFSEMTKENYYELNIASCNLLQEKLGIPKSFRI
jgi:Fe-S-cluster containining protein